MFARKTVAGMEIYRGALTLEDAVLIWIRPIPRPPSAPASNPSRISSGTLSMIEDLPSLAIESPT
jgi:hypothetical protein